MNGTLTIRILAVAVAAAIGIGGAALSLAQPAAPPAPSAMSSDMPPLVKNPRISVDYEEPHHPIYAYILDQDDARVAKEFSQLVKRYEHLKGVRERLMKRMLLEEFSQFLAPLRLPINLRLITQQCDTVNAFYDPRGSRLVMCYEWVAEAEETAPKAPTPQGITRQDAILGSVVGTMLHEAGHAVSNLLRLPVLGREEDTADQIAAFVMLQFGRDVARTLIKGEAYSWARKAARPARYWGVHSTALQRLHLNLCLAYGSDPEAFEDFVVKFRWLPQSRAANCAQEYRQVQHAFRATVLPHLDMELMDKVRARKWLRPEDGTKR